MRAFCLGSALTLVWIMASSDPWHWTFLALTLPLAILGFLFGERMPPLEPAAKVKHERYVLLFLVGALIGKLVLLLTGQPTLEERLRQFQTNDWRRDWQTNVVPKEIGP